MLLGIFLLASASIFFSSGLSSDRVPMALGFTAVFLVPLYLARVLIFILEPDSSTSQARQWLLLYHPGRWQIGLLHLLFHLNLLLFVSFAFGLSELSARVSIKENGNNIFPVFVGFTMGTWFVLILLIREIAVSMNPLRDPAAARSWLAKLFFLWRPRTAVAWLPRLVFYAALLPIAFLSIHAFFTTDPWSDVQRALFLYAPLLVAARGWSNSLQRRLGPDPSGIRRLLELVTIPLPARAATLAPWLMFVVSTAVLGGIIVVGKPVLFYLGAQDLRVGYVKSIFCVTCICAAAWTMTSRRPSS